MNRRWRGLYHVTLAAVNQMLSFNTMPTIDTVHSSGFRGSRALLGSTTWAPVVPVILAAMVSAETTASSVGARRQWQCGRSMDGGRVCLTRMREGRKSRVASGGICSAQDHLSSWSRFFTAERGLAVMRSRVGSRAPAIRSTWWLLSLERCSMHRSRESG